MAMNVVFLTISTKIRLNDRGIYQDLLRHFRDNGHKVWIVKIASKNTTAATEVVDGANVVNVFTPSVVDNKSIKKGIATLLVDYNFTRAVKRYLSGVDIDLILYATPPITYSGTIKYLKRQHPSALSYLLLKDIFPQNAVDMGMFSQKSVIHNYFRHKEKELYRLSDVIGCMSPANVQYLLRHNPDIQNSKVEIAPNSMDASQCGTLTKEEVDEIRERNGLPQDKVIFVYGGNLGKPQGIDFLIACLESNKDREDCYFLIMGSGTEYTKIQQWIATSQPNNITLKSRVPQDQYLNFVRSCDVGMIFLDHRFTIPNYPSRLLSYLQNSMPILAATDPNTDIGSMAMANGYGLWCESNDVEAFTKLVDYYVAHPQEIKEMGQKGREFMEVNYLTEHTYQAIIKHVNLGY